MDTDFIGVWKEKGNTAYVKIVPDGPQHYRVTYRTWRPQTQHHITWDTEVRAFLYDAEDLTIVVVQKLSAASSDGRSFSRSPIGNWDYFYVKVDKNSDPISADIRYRYLKEGQNSLEALVALDAAAVKSNEEIDDRDESSITSITLRWLVEMANEFEKTDLKELPLKPVR